ncbi:MAG: flagellar basal body L-ring protein FlgH [Alphaproteobacteria bacterium]
MTKNLLLISKTSLLNTAKTALIISLVSSVSACGILGRLSEVGKPPAISKIENPTEKADYQPVSMPMPEPKIAQPSTNSLWRTGSRSFFKDQRASNIGDILTVKVTIEDDALLENKSEQKRGSNSDSLSVNALGGLESYANKILPDAVDPSNLIDIESKRSITGDGSIDRNEKINMTMAAVVTQIMPNGNLVIHGSQEVRVNYELRRLELEGIIRREDISSQNTIESKQIAELRVGYGGRGTLSDIQQPRYGSQVMDIVMPF